MADASKLKRLGAPPSLDEARSDLIPETIEVPSPPKPKLTPKPTQAVKAEDDYDPFEKIDLRSLRKTGRTVPFSTRVSDDLDLRIRRLAAKHKLKLVEIIEQGVGLLEEKLNGLR